VQKTGNVSISVINPFFGYFRIRVFKTSTRKGQNGHFSGHPKMSNFGGGVKNGHFWFMDFPICKRNIFDGFIIETSFGGCPESNLYKLLILNGIFSADLLSLVYI
jgi:hypothetical protein